MKSISTKQIKKDLSGQKLEGAPKKRDAASERIMELIQIINDQEFPITTTFFSDTVVISSDERNIVASQLVLDLIAKLNVRLWKKWQILARGAIVRGKIFHEQDDILFGPALNLAHNLESKVACFPRVVIDPDCMQIFENQPTFSKMRELVNLDKENEYAYISLPSSLLYLERCTLEDKGKRDLRRSLPEVIQDMMEEIDSSRVKEKYKWLLKESKKYSVL